MRLVSTCCQSSLRLPCGAACGDGEGGGEGLEGGEGGEGEGGGEGLEGGETACVLVPFCGCVGG